MSRLCDVLGENLRAVRFTLPYAAAQTLDLLYRDAHVKKAAYVPEGIDVEAVVDERTYGRIRAYLTEPDHGAV